MTTHRPALSPFARELYEDRIHPLVTRDAENEYAMAHLVCAAARMIDPIEFVRDDASGPGYSGLLDLNRAPADGLGWLAMFAGVRLIDGSTDVQQRERIDGTDGFQRGTPAAIIAAAQATLTGTRVVRVLERINSAYSLTVITRVSETTDAAATNRALQAAKPVGLILTHIVSDSPLINEGTRTIDAGSGTIDSATLPSVT